MIGLLGGTFDPIHYGHLRLAQELASTLKLHEVRFIPAASPPHRDQPAASAEHRANMVRLAIADNPSFKLDTRELNRSGLSYTIDTLESLHQELGRRTAICLLVGGDAFLGMTSWKRWQELLDYCHIVVAERPQSSLAIDSMSAALKALWDKHGTSDSAELTSRQAGCILMHHITPLDISATAIRADLQAGSSARYLLPDSVVDYISQHRLYS